MARSELRPSIACIGVVGREPPAALGLKQHDQAILFDLQNTLGAVPCRWKGAYMLSQNQLLHFSLFPPYSNAESDTAGAAPASLTSDSAAARDTPAPLSVAFQVAPIEFHFLLQSALDVFEFRNRDRTRVDQDLGLLHAIDERLSVWGWETPTGTKFIIVLDAWGRPERSEGGDGDTHYLPGMGGGGGLGWGMKDGELKPAFRALQAAYIRLLQNPFYLPDDHVPLEISGAEASEISRERPRPITSKRFIREVNRIGVTWQPGVTNL